MNVKKRFTFGEEIANAVSHGIGAAFAIAGLVLLILYSTKTGSTKHIVTFSIFGATLTLLYLSSTLNHALRAGKLKDFFHNFDQIAIYLLIAGTYTPIAIVGLVDDWGWLLFGLQWGIALSGILVKSLMPNNFEKGVSAFFVLSYIVMGWMLLGFLLPIFRNIPFRGILFIFIGGACYTIGTIFFNLKGVRYSHLVWHVFVIAGSVFHWIAIMRFVLPLHLS